MTNTDDTRDLLTACLKRVRDANAAWERHMNRYHPPYRRAAINLTAPWWDCLPHSAPYGDELEYRLMEALGMPLEEARS